MVKARREFVGAAFVDGMLFPNEPLEEIIDPAAILDAVLKEAKFAGKTSWKLLRASTTIANPCSYTDSELNDAIKRGIRIGQLLSTADGKRVEEKALVWLPAKV